MTEKKPRHYQAAMIAATIRDWAMGIKRAFCSMPTGTGKTFTIVSLENEVWQPGDRVLFLVNAERLMHQAAREFDKQFNPKSAPGTIFTVGKIQGVKHRDYGANIVVAMVQSLSSRRLGTILKHGQFNRVYIDEAHRFVAKTYVDAVERVMDKCPDAFALGVTATPFRHDNESLERVFPQVGERGEFTYVYPLIDAIRDGYLAPIDAVQIYTKLDVKIGKSGWVPPGQMDSLWAANNWAKLLTEAWLEHACGWKRDKEDVLQGDSVVSTLAFMPSVRISQAFAAYLGRECGILAGHVDGEQALLWDFEKDDFKQMDRGELDTMFERGEFPFYTNFGIHTTGSDFPVTRCVILGRPTNSAGLYQQMVGRGLRTDPDDPEKRCTLIDVGFEGHGLITPFTFTGRTESKEVRELEKQIAQLTINAGPTAEQVDKSDPAYRPTCPQCFEGGLARVPGTPNYICDRCHTIFGPDVVGAEDFSDVLDPDTFTGLGVYAKFIDLMARQPIAWFRRDGFYSASLGIGGRGAARADRVLLIAPPGKVSGYPEEHVLLGVYRKPQKEKSPGGYPKLGPRNYRVILTAPDLDDILQRAADAAEEYGDPLLANKDKEWRRKPCTDAQAKELKRWGCNPEYYRRGEASRLQTYMYTMSYLKRQGIIIEPEAPAALPEDIEAAIAAVA